MQEHERHERVVTVKEPMRVTPSLYFGTRRCTYSDVVSVVTTARPIPRLSFCHQHHNVQPHYSLSPTRSQTTRTDSASSAFNEFPFAVGAQLPVLLDSPLGGDRDRQHRTNAWKASVLSTEKQIFMARLQQKRRERFEREQRAALAIQRVYRGYVLRQRFRELRTKLQVRKRIRGSLVKVTRGTAIIAGEKDRRARVLAAQHAGAVTVQRAFRAWCARKCVAKARALRIEELQTASVTILQRTWRRSVARTCVRKARSRLAEQRQRALAVLVTRLVQGYYARQRVRRIVLRQQWLAAQRLQWTVQRFLAERARRLEHRQRYEEQHHCAAITVQRIVRGHRSRTSVARLRLDEELAIRIACALTIQRLVRGCDGRERARFQRAFLAYERAWQCALHVTRLVRGFLARRLAATERVLQETDLLVQTRRGNVSTVIDLLDGFGAVDDEPADVTVVSSGAGNSIVHVAATYGHGEILTHVVPKLLVKSSTAGMVYALNRRGESPLELAIVHGHEQIASYLLATTASFGDASVRPQRREAPSEPTRERSLLLLAARSGMGSLVAKLALLFPHIFTGREHDSWTLRTALHEALLLSSDRIETHSAASAHEDRIVATMTTVLAKLAMVQIDAQDVVGFTALHLAAQLGNLRAVRLLLEYGADVTVADAQGRTAWRIALLTVNEPCFVEIRRKWLDSVPSAAAVGGRGAQELLDRDESSIALVNAATRSLNAVGHQQLHPQLEQEVVDACRAGRIARVRFLVDEFSVSINTTDTAGARDSLLLIACRAGNVELARYLVAQGGVSEPLAVEYVNAAGESAVESALNSPRILSLLRGRIYIERRAERPQTPADHAYR